ncbi:sensor histidine kinase [Jiangella mangrovi]|uniref:histidine kinase n=1 Tax=Jiangella mangrovi TaxID=1524084 RepID=A0A7W9GTZ2_9ACTN|nr:histidine kinase [Jiangella mangrovi]MBB5790008.1 signal transduction histidine kinase [Jiangella mangrovi]
MPDRSWRLVVTGAVVAGAVIVGATRPWTVPLGCALVVAVVVPLWWPRSRAWLAWGAAGAGVVSLAATAAHVAGPWPGSPPFGMVELLALSGLVGACARWAPGRSAVPAAVLAGLGGATSLLRATDAGAPDDLTALEAVYAVSFWALAPIVAAGAGLFLRYQHDRRARAVAAARRAQRLELARDLHDYVAHDVSEMIAQAQAAGTIAPAGTPAGDALRRIEAAGLRAMASMDRTVRVLSTDDEIGSGSGSGGSGGSGGGSGSGVVRPQPGLADLPALVERFAASGPAQVRLDSDDDLMALVPREVGGTAHRVIVEALTNVRRHAPGAAVEVRLRRCGDELEVSVLDDGGSADPVAVGSGPGLGRSGGLGLPGLAERVGALGGSLRAGPDGAGWRLVARLPLTGPAGTGGAS